MYQLLIRNPDRFAPKIEWQHGMNAESPAMAWEGMARARARGMVCKVVRCTGTPTTGSAPPDHPFRFKKFHS